MVVSVLPHEAKAVLVVGYLAFSRTRLGEVVTWMTRRDNGLAYSSCNAGKKP